MDKKLETTRMGYIGTTTRIHSFMHSLPKVSLGFNSSIVITGVKHETSLPVS